MRAVNKPLILVRGAGDLATGTIHRLWSAGYPLLVLEAERPAAIRRQVAFSEAVYEGTAAVEGLTAKKIRSTEELEQTIKEGFIPLLVDPEGKAIAQVRPGAVVDAILAKKNLGTKEVYEDRKESYVERIKAILEYAETDDKCRSRMLLRYFGEKNEHNCGQCDVCQAQHETGLKTYQFDEWEEKICTLLKEKSYSTEELIEQLGTDDKGNLLKVLTYLLAEEKICQKDGFLSI